MSNKNDVNYEIVKEYMRKFQEYALKSEKKQEKSKELEVNSDAYKYLEKKDKL